MPTGYTSIIEEGGSFEEYVWRCARAFGALIAMREESLNAAIILPKPNPYYQDQVRAIEQELFSLQDLSEELVEKLATEEYARAYADWAKQRAKERKQFERYTTMREKVEAWAPPTEDHVKLKEFMLEQIALCIGSGPYEWPSPVKKSGEEYRANEIASLSRRLKYNQEKVEDEKRRVEERVEWIKQLMESVPIPEKLR